MTQATKNFFLCMYQKADQTTQPSKKKSLLIYQKVMLGGQPRSQNKFVKKMVDVMNTVSVKVVDHWCEQQPNVKQLLDQK